MDNREPGPIALEEAPPRLDVFSGPVFEPLFEPLSHLVGAAETVLGRAALDVAEPGGPTLDDVWASTVGYADDVTNGQINAGDQSEAAYLTETGNDGDQLRESVLPYLPPPDTDVESNFTEVPMPPPLVTPGNPRPPNPDPNREYE